MGRKVTTSVSLRPEQAQWLDDQEVSFSQAVRNAIDHYEEDTEGTEDR